jgi:hypothetical protein
VFPLAAVKKEEWNLGRKYKFINNVSFRNVKEQRVKYKDFNMDFFWNFE